MWTELQMLKGKFTANATYEVWGTDNCTSYSMSWLFPHEPVQGGGEGMVLRGALLVEQAEMARAQSIIQGLSLPGARRSLMHIALHSTPALAPLVKSN